MTRKWLQPSPSPDTPWTTNTQKGQVVPSPWQKGKYPSLCSPLSLDPTPALLSCLRASCVLNIPQLLPCVSRKQGQPLNDCHSHNHHKIDIHAELSSYLQPIFRLRQPSNQHPFKRKLLVVQDTLQNHGLHFVSCFFSVFSESLHPWLP